MAPHTPPYSPTQTLMDDLVSIPDDLISEESDFHGDIETKSLYNKLADSYDPSKYWAIHEWSTQVIAVKGMKAWEKAEELRLKKEKEDAEKRERERDKALKGSDGDDKQQIRQGPVIAAKNEEGNEDDLVDKMDLDPPAATTTTTTTTNTATAVPASSPNDPRPQNYYEGVKSAKQLSESVSEFLTRMPPSTTTSSHAGSHWLWILNPFPRNANNNNGTSSHAPESSAGDIATFRQLGTRLLDDFISHRTDLEAEHPDKPAASITRMLYPNRLELESDLRKLAKQNGVTHGKWMLFLPEDDAAEIDRVWSVVCTATWEGKLGGCAKIATKPDNAVDEEARKSSDDGDDDAAAAPASRRFSRDRDKSSQRLLCIYTDDFSDTADVRRVLEGIKSLGLLGSRAAGAGAGEAGMKTIYYKADAWTYLDIVSGNAFKIKASMYSSADVDMGGSGAAPGGGGGGGRGGSWSRGSGRGRGRGQGRGRGRWAK